MVKGKIRRSLILTGFMGAGKSTVGRALSKKLSLPLYDTDEMIVAQEGIVISDIFAWKGELYFRDLETLVIKKMPAGLYILSTGGGAVLRPENREILKMLGWLVYLKADPMVVFDRITRKSDPHKPLSRPLLDVEDPVAKIQELMSKREEAYLDCDIALDTSNQHYEDIAACIIERVQRLEIERL